jgi:hypothetical protein
MELRVTRKLKGKKPCFIYMKKNKGQIYNEGQSDFVMTITDKYIHFQKLSFFLRKLQPEKDFKIERGIIKTYSVYQINIATTMLNLYTVDRKYLQIYFNVGIADTIETENNINEIIGLLEAQGVKEYK